jgi:hypothetical protein
MCQSYKGVCGPGDARGLGDSVTLGAELARGLVTDQSISATPFGYSASLGAEAARGLAINQSINAIAVL